MVCLVGLQSGLDNDPTKPLKLKIAKSLRLRGVCRVDWRSYNCLRPWPVFDIYMKYWGDVELAGSGVLGDRVQVIKGKV